MHLNRIPPIDFIDPHRQEEIQIFIDEWFNERDFVEVKSSGSTGAPKTIRLQKKNVRISAQKTNKFFGLTSTDSCFLCLSTQTIGGKMMIVRALEAQMKLIVGKVAAHALDDLSTPVTFAAIVPVQLDYQLQNNSKKLHFIEKLIVGGAAISANTSHFLRKQKLTVYQTFGMTETISHVAIRKVGYEEEEFYQGLDNITFSTQEQHLIIDYPEIEINQLKTNDLVELKSPTQFKWLGRADFVINSGGVKIIPEQVESKLSKFISSPFFVYGVPDEKLGHKVVLFIEGPCEIEIKDLRSLLDKYEVPKEIRTVEQFVRTKGDKINRIASIALI